MAVDKKLFEWNLRGNTIAVMTTDAQYARLVASEYLATHGYSFLIQIVWDEEPTIHSGEKAVVFVSGRGGIDASQTGT